jgi:DNA-binding winged helix-turn-helix (wHTH) protein
LQGKSLLKAGLSQDIIVTVRQRGFILATGSLIVPVVKAFQTDSRNSSREMIRPLLSINNCRQRAVGPFKLMQNTFYQNISLLRKSLLKAGLSQDIIVTVRQRGFIQK